MAEHAPSKPLHQPSGPGLFSRAVPGLLALACGAAAMVLAAHHPLAPWLALALAGVASAAFAVFPFLWLVLVPALLPVVDLAPWTGWITFEELDILVLTAAFGGYLRMAAYSVGKDRPRHSHSGRGQSRAVLVWLLATLFAGSTMTALVRGMADAGGFQLGWYQGYHEPMNSLRLAKCFLLALLMLPLWRAARLRDAGRAIASLSPGLTMGLAFAALATVWERDAFTGLLNFSSDYRTTGMFWEMHVGGAALDGFLALTVPFAVREMLVAKTQARWGAAVAVVALAAYACLTTFSRGVYLAIPIGLAVYLGLHLREQVRDMKATGAPMAAKGAGVHAGILVVLVAAFGAGAAWVFQTSGYRGMAAFFVCTALMLPMAAVLRGFTVSQWLMGFTVGAGLVMLALALAWLVPKGAYVAWGLASAMTVGTLYVLRQCGPASLLLGPVAFAGFLAMVAGTAMVAEHWGDSSGLQHALPVLAVVICLCIAAGARKTPLWPVGLRWQGAAVGAMGVVAAVVAVFNGGTYISERFSTGGQDFGGRQAHWQLGRDMLRTPADWVLGKGMGRFPASYFLAGNPMEHPGDFRLRRDGGNPYVTLMGGLHVNGWGEIFRVTQRVQEPGKTAVVTASVRADKDVSLHFEVCEKHLLYNNSCLIKPAGVKGMPGVWQPVRVVLEGASPTRGDWYAPRLLAFSMAMSSAGGTADVDNVTLTSDDGRVLLENGDFSREMAHWFFSSDRHHMPWHIKSMLMNVLFDQGILGLALWSLMLAGALWRTSFGRARRHPLAPALAAALAGFVVVGLFDSLLDVPRVAWLFYFLMLLGLTIRWPRSSTSGGRVGAPAVAALAVLVMGSSALISPALVRAAEKTTSGHILQVGASRPLKTIAAASLAVRDHDTVEIDAGDYVADVAVWERDDVTLRAVGGRVRLLAQGAAAEGKAIWVVRAKAMQIDGFDFSGARVEHQNGAGIRLERGSLTVRNCSFSLNENGILTGNQPDTELTIENSEFGYNGHGDGQSHNLYVGSIGRLSVKDSHFHHAKVGHLLKSRAALNVIVGNRLTDGVGGTASYELEFPNGGIATVLGNVIAQSTSTENPQLISYGVEGYKWPRNELQLEGNTLVNPLTQGGVFLRVAQGPVLVRAINNRLAGAGKLESAGPGEYRNNVHVELGAYFGQSPGQ